MRKSLFFILLIVGIAVNGYAIQRVPARQISVDGAETNIDTVASTVITWLYTNSVKNTSDIETNRTSADVGIASNATDIADNYSLMTNLVASNATDIATNEIDIATNVINIATNAAWIASRTNKTWGMYAWTLESGAADTWHELDYGYYMDSFSTDNISKTTGRVTAPKAGFYLLTGIIVVGDDFSPNDWKGAFSINGNISNGVGEYLIRLFGQQSEEGAGAFSGSSIYYLDAGDYVSMWVYHAVDALSSTVKLYEWSFNVRYLGE